MASLLITNALSLALILPPACSVRYKLHEFRDISERAPLTIEEKGLVQTYAHLLARLDPASVATAENSLIKRFHELRVRKPADVEAEFELLTGAAMPVEANSKGRRWATELVESLQTRMDKEGEEGMNYSKLRDAYHLAKELQKVANSPVSYRKLTAEAISEAKQKYMTDRNAITFHSDFGNAILNTTEHLFDDAVAAGLDVTQPEVQASLGSFASNLASAGYQTQLGQHKASYGTWSSEK